jgi:hypothetical protein
MFVPKNNHSATRYSIPYWHAFTPTQTQKLYNHTNKLLIPFFWQQNARVHLPLIKSTFSTGWPPHSGPVIVLIVLIVLIVTIPVAGEWVRVLGTYVCLAHTDHIRHAGHDDAQVRDWHDREEAPHADQGLSSRVGRGGVVDVRVGNIRVAMRTSIRFSWKKKKKEEWMIT